MQRRAIWACGAVVLAGLGCGGSGDGADPPGKLTVVDPPSNSGCADGTREAYTDMSTFPDISGCSGGFSVAGLVPVPLVPRCNHTAGNSSSNPNGEGCGAADLCAAAWHVCESAADLASHSSTGSCDDRPGFWATSQGTTGPNQPACVPAGANNVLGCGTLFNPAMDASCMPLTRMGIYSDQGAAWYFGDNNPMFIYTEAAIVTKSGPDDGGVLCCRDP